MKVTKFSPWGVPVVSTVSGIVSDHSTGTTDAHAATAVSFTPAGTIAATDVQAAIEEVAAEAAGSGAVATDVIFDAKGDLAVGTGADTAQRLAVGANDTVPMADSGQTTGIKWVGSQTPSTQAFSDSATEGTADTYARGDHKHGMPVGPGPGPGGSSTPTLVQIKNSGVTNSSLVMTLNAAPVNGNLLVLAAMSNGGGALTSVVQTNVTWTLIYTGTPVTSTHLNIWIGQVAASAAALITITRPGGNATWSVIEISGAPSVTPAAGVTAEEGSGTIGYLPTQTASAITAGRLVVYAVAGVSQNIGALLDPNLPSVGLNHVMCCVKVGYATGTYASMGAMVMNAASGASCIVEVT